jgi:chromosome segregation ATPase
MEEKKSHELGFEIKEVSGGSNTQFKFLIESGELRETAIPKTKHVFQLPDIGLSSNLSVSVLVTEKIIGATKISFVTLFGESLQGKVDRWFKIKSEDYSNLKLKIAVSLGKPEKTKPKPAVNSKRSSKGFKEPKCPYLESLATGKENNTEALDEIWKYRDNNMKNYIKISLEPDSPGRPELEGLDITQNIEEISIEKIQTMSGSQLKQVVKMLCEEAKHLTVISQKLPEIREELTQKVSERRELEQNSQQEINLIKENWIQKHEEIKILQQKRQEKKNLLLEQKEKSRKLEAELDIVKAHLGDVKRENIILAAQKVQYDDCVQSKAELQQLIQNSLEKKEILQEKVNKARADISESKNKAVEDINQIKQERDEAKAKIEEVDKEYKAAHEQNESLKAKIHQLRAQLSDAQELKNKVKESIEAYKAESNKRDEVNQSLESLTSELEKQSNEILSHQQDLISLKKASASKLTGLEISIENKELEILNLRKQLFEASAQKIAQEQVCCIRADLAQLIEDLERLHKLHEDSRSDILRDLESGSKILLEESEKVFLQAEKLDQMIDAVDKKEEELDGLKNTALSYKKTNFR